MATAAKNIVITVGQQSIARNILHSFVLDNLLSKSRADVYLLVPSSEKRKYEEEFSSSRVHVIRRTVAVTFFDRVMRYLCRHGFRAKTIMTDQRTRLLFDKNYISFIAKRALMICFGSSRGFHSLLRRIAKFRRAPKDLKELMKKLEVHLLVATDVQDNFDIEAMRAARDLEIKVVSMVRSWDNLVSEGGLIQIIPDRLIVWNPYLSLQAIALHHVPAERVIIAGIPHYDWYLKTELIESREQFFSKIGLDPAKKTILFTGLGNFFAPHEVEVVEMIAEAFKLGALPPDVQMLFRPHPSYDVEGKERLVGLVRTVFDAGVSPFTDDRGDFHKREEEKIARQLNSLYHSDVIVTTPSSMIIDALPFNKPAVGVVFDGKGTEPHWKSVKRYIAGYTHIHDLVQLQGFPLAYDLPELIRAINQQLANPKQYAAGMEKVFEQFIGKLDGRSGERFAAAILEML